MDKSILAIAVDRSWHYSAWWVVSLSATWHLWHIMCLCSQLCSLMYDAITIIYHTVVSDRAEDTEWVGLYLCLYVTNLQIYYGGYWFNSIRDSRHCLWALNGIIGNVITSHKFHMEYHIQKSPLIQGAKSKCIHLVAIIRTYELKCTHTAWYYEI